MSNRDTSPLIAWTEQGLYCARGDFHIDPHRAVKTAVITHAHSDHARRGCGQYICAASSVGLVKTRLGASAQTTGVPFRESFLLGEVSVRFHPAGHILGSAQVRVEHEGEVWVASGDYKREADPSCEPFEIVKCDTFITEATFGTPKYIWDKNREHGKDIFSWWQENRKSGFNSLVFGYSLGKAQRILACLAPLMPQRVLIHPTMAELTDCYRKEGRLLSETEVITSDLSRKLKGELILAPPSIMESEFAVFLGKYKTAFASGWMQGTSHFRKSSYDHGFVLSDHADWADLNRTIDETGAKRVFVLHRNGVLIRHLRKRGLDAHPSSALTPENFRRLASINLELFTTKTDIDTPCPKHFESP